MAIPDRELESVRGGSAIQRLRLRQRLSQQDLAARVGLSRSRIAQFEAGHAIPPDVLRRIAEELSVSPADLIGRADDLPGHAADDVRDLSAKLASLAVRDPQLARELYDLGSSYLSASAHQLFPFGQQLFEQARSVLGGLTGGSLTISHPSSIHMWKKFLESEELGPDDVIEAVTVGETHAWWKSPDGEEYHELNLSLADAGVTIVRIFVVASVAELLSLRTPILRHLEKNIPCYVLSPDPGMVVPVFLVISTKRMLQHGAPRDPGDPAQQGLENTGYQLVPRRAAELQTIRRNSPATTRIFDDAEQCRAAHVRFETIRRKAYQIRAEDIDSFGAVASALSLPDTATGPRAADVPWASSMLNSNLNRSCFATSLPYVSGAELDDHVDAITRGVRFEWLLCEAGPSLEDRGTQARTHRKSAEMVTRYKDRLLAANVSGQQIEDQITIRVLPRNTVGGVAAWNNFLPLTATFFAAEFCILTPPDYYDMSYERILNAIVLSSPGFDDLYRKFMALYAACPTYEQWMKASPVPVSDNLGTHRLRTLYDQFSKSISDHVGRLSAGIV